MTTTTLTALEQYPPKCLRPGIWRHWAPNIEDVDLNGEEGVWHAIVTSDSGPVVGQLIRWVWDGGEVGYEVRINGLEDNGGVSDIAAFDVDSLRCLAFVSNSLRQEWEIVTGVSPGSKWTYNFQSRWPNERYPDEMCQR